MRFLLFSLTFFWVTFTAKAQTPFFPQYNVEAEKWSFIDTSGKTVLELSLTQIEDLRPFYDGLAAAQDETTHLWGFIDTKGKWLIKPQYAKAHDFTDGYAIVVNPCEANCNTNTDGLLSSDISYIIDKTGKTVFTDKSQEADPKNRFFLDKNLGNGLFRTIMGYGVSDMKNVIDLKGNFLCATYSVFGFGDIEFEPDLKAYKCKNIYYDLTGKKVLDLSKYTFVNAFSEGLAWVNEEQETIDESITWNILVDLKGKEIHRFKNSEIGYPEPVENGSFLYTDAEGATMRYILKDKKIVKYETPETEELSGLTVGKKDKNGIRYIYSMDEVPRLVGFINGSGETYFTNP